MKQFRILFFLSLILLLTSGISLAQKINAKKIVKTHKIFAVLPPDVSIEADKKLDSLAKKELERIESLDFQKVLYSWILKRKAKGEIAQEIQSIDSTNLFLRKLNYPEKTLSIDELCTVLGVDGIISINLYTTNIMSEGASIALALILPGHGLFPTNNLRGTANLYDCKDKKMIWNSYHKLSGTVGSNSEKLSEKFMKITSREIPYNKEVDADFY